MNPEDIITWKGKDIREMTHAELEAALRQICVMYHDLLEQNLQLLLKALCDAVGELPSVETDQATKKAYSAASNYLDPDEFTARFMAKHRSGT